MIKLHPHPPAISDDVEIVTTLQFLQNIFSTTITYLPQLFNDDLPVACTIKTSGHLIVTGWIMDFEGENLTPGYLEGLEQWFDGNLLGYWEEGVQHVGFVIPMSDQVVIHVFSATGATAYVLLTPGPVPNSFAYSPVHDHMPHGGPEGEYDPLEDLIGRAGRHLWGATWKVIDLPC